MGIGIDIIEIDRIKKIVCRNKFLISTVFSEDEIEQLINKQDIYSSIAGRFCAKEAFFKCLGTGIESLNMLKLIRILNDKNGKPEIYLNGILLEKYKNFEFHVSISHCKSYACAVVSSKKSYFS